MAVRKNRDGRFCFLIEKNQRPKIGRPNCRAAAQTSTTHGLFIRTQLKPDTKRIETVCKPRRLRSDRRPFQPTTSPQPTILRRQLDGDSSLHAARRFSTATFADCCARRAAHLSFRRAEATKCGRRNQKNFLSSAFLASSARILPLLRLC